jgi:hypothetical protein
MTRTTRRNDATNAPPQRRYTPDWRWRTFPVFCAFVAGLLIASFINGRPGNGVAAAVQIVAILGVSYAAIHLVVTNVIVSGRARRRDATIARGEIPEDEWEEETVYRDER